MSSSAPQPLLGCSVLITRPAHQADRLGSLIRDAGGEPVLFPALAIEPPADPAPIRTLLQRTVDFDLTIFVSPNAVEQASALSAAPWCSGLKAAAIGEGTAAALRHRGISEVLVPRDGADSEALLSMLELSDVRDKQILILRGAGGRETLADELRRRGAKVTYAECYRRVRPRADASPLLERWERDALHAVTVMSSETLENLWSMIGERGHRLLRRTPLFMPHASIAQRAARLGLTETAITPPGDEGLLRGLSAWFALQRR